MQDFKRCLKFKFKSNMHFQLAKIPFPQQTSLLHSVSNGYGTFRCVGDRVLVLAWLTQTLNRAIIDVINCTCAFVSLT